MAVRIRLRRQGCCNNRSYRVVVADSRAPRDGKYIECIGWYSPRMAGQKFAIDLERVAFWESQGALPSDTVAALVQKQKSA